MDNTGSAISTCAKMNRCFHLAILHGHCNSHCNPCRGQEGFTLEVRDASRMQDANDYTTAIRVILEMRRRPSDAKVK